MMVIPIIVMVVASLVKSRHDGHVTDLQVAVLLFQQLQDCLYISMVVWVVDYLLIFLVMAIMQVTMDQ